MASVSSALLALLSPQERTDMEKVLKALQDDPRVLEKPHGQQDEKVQRSDSETAQSGEGSTGGQTRKSPLAQGHR